MLDKLRKLDKLLSMAPEERRRLPREEVTDGTVKILDTVYPMKNWSARSFLAMPCTLDRKIGDRLEIEISVPLGERRLDFACTAAVVRINEERQEFAGIFLNVDAATQAVIDEHFGVFTAKSWRRSVLERLGLARPRGAPQP